MHGWFPSLSDESRGNFLLWSVLVYGARWFDALAFQVLGKPVALCFFHHSRRVFWLFLLAGACWIVKRKRLCTSLWFLPVPVSFVLVEAYHDAYNQGFAFWNVLRHVIGIKMISSTLAGFALICFFELHRDEVTGDRFRRSLSAVISVKALILMAIAGLGAVDVLHLGNEHIYNYSQAYESLTVLFLLLFFPPEGGNVFQRVLFVLNSVSILFFECRGASVTFLLLFMVYCLGRIFRANGFERNRTLIPAATMALFTAIHCLGVNPIGVTVMERVHQGERFSSVMKEHVDWEVRKRTFSRVFQFEWRSSPVSAPGFSDGRDGHSDESNPPTLQRGEGSKECESVALAERYLTPAESRAESARNRVGVMVEALRAFVSSPIFGVGCDRAYGLKVGDDGLHSYLSLVLAAFGLCGLVPLGGFFVLQGVKTLKEGAGLLLTVASIGYLLAVMMFNNEFLWWYPLVLIWTMNWQKPPEGQVGWRTI